MKYISPGAEPLLYLDQDKYSKRARLKKKRAPAKMNHRTKL